MTEQINNRLTLEIISDYIKKNLCNFNDEEEIILINKESLVKNIEKKELTFIDKVNLLKTGEFLQLDINFFHNIQFLEFITDLYLLKSHSDENEIYSFYTSILSIFDNNFLNKSIEEQNMFIEYIITHFKSEISQDAFRQHGYSSLKWTKKQILEIIKNNIISDNLLRVISDILHVNLFYIDNDDNNKIKYVGGDFIVFKNIIILLKMKNIFYPIYDKENNKMIFDFKSNNFIKSILINPECLTLIFCEKFICVSRKFNLNSDKSFNNIKKQNNFDKENNNHIDNIKYNDTDNSDENCKKNTDLLTINGFEEEETETKFKMNDTDLNKSFKNYNDEINESLSLIELQKIAKKKNIDIFNYINDSRKLKNKRELCNDIIKNS